MSLNWQSYPNMLRQITKANGIGAKGASRIILELKDKLRMEDMMDARI